jgi:quercetin dioxygenase-like cupin family protein
MDAVRVLDRSSIEDKPWEPLRGLAGVRHKVLWRSGEMIVGIVRLEPGAEEPGHAHHDAVHHVYVLHGSARIGGQTVEAGGLAVVPAGIRHAITHVGADGCTLFYTYAAGH